MILLPLCLLSCSTSVAVQEKKAEKLAEAQQLRRQIQDSIDARSFTVTMDYVSPMLMQARSLDNDYSITLKGDTLTSWLPYFGESHKADIVNNDKSPLSFVSAITEWSVTKPKDDAYYVFFKAANNGEIFNYMLMMFDNGKVTVSIDSPYRDKIDFGGKMNVIPDKTNTTGK